MVLAEGDDELFVLGREGIEFVEFHTAMFYGRRNGRDCPNGEDQFSFGLRSVQR
jgi:hypothetical protein